jgi:RNA polymerase II subunit A small phosphatase-like protein
MKDPCQRAIGHAALSSIETEEVVQSIKAFDISYAREFDIGYALPVMQGILPWFPAQRILWCGHCHLVKGFIVKDLSIFNRDLAQVVLVDNSPQSFVLHPQDGIPISTWVGDYSDTALMDQLLPFLRYCGSVDDVRSVILHRFTQKIPFLVKPESECQFDSIWQMTIIPIRQ